ncbi:MAG TPA: isoleucine--tRNA ligase [Firmicutes bacterium]|nr:isoleucine--tRNA ligase [Bacillota bacterium]
MELKKTLNMPKGKFEMRGNLTIKEPEFLKRFDALDLYHKLLEKNKGNKPFYLHDGPPYANNDIHAGHALNRIVKDIYNRYKNLKGYYVEFTPGWDTHGLPIENAVTKSGKDRRKMSVTDFRKCCEEYALKQVEKQKAQMKRLGVVADWNEPYLTLQPKYEKAQIEIFADMALKGYIYRGLKPVNWSYSSESALAEAEIEYQDVEATTIYVSFKVVEDFGPIKAGDAFVIWTTTPWTIPANLAICLNPDLEYGVYQCDQGRLIFLTSLSETLIDKLGLSNVSLKSVFKGKDVEGARTRHPLYDRDSVIIVGDHVTDDAGTGCVHTAPGHGMDDYKVCQKYGIQPFCPVDNQGKMTAEAGERLAGLFYEDANEMVLTMLKETGALLHSEKIVHSYPFDWRTHKPLIFRATTQWFASLSKFKDQLLKAVDEVEFKPSWGKNRLYKMIEGREDWCISRQRAWGVPIPIIYCEDETPIIDKKVFDHIANIIGEKGSSAWFELSAKELLPDNYTNPHSPNGIFTKEKDIMDVWFDSGSSFKAVDINRSRPFPADVYLEGNDQYRGWYNASIILSVATTGEKPFKKVVTHGMMVDANGEKFSKSKGNGVDPNKICQQYGADIFRLWTTFIDFTQETKLSEELIKITSDSYRKIRNTMKFMLANIYDDEEHFAEIDEKQLELSIIDKMILNQLNYVLSVADKAYNNFEYSTVNSVISNFIINDLSAFYLDISKDYLYCDKKNSPRRKAIQYVLLQLTKKLAIVLDPILPFTMEEVNDHLPENVKTPVSIALSSYPDTKYDEKLLGEYAKLQQVLSKIKSAIEEKRQTKEINSSSEAHVTYKVEKDEKELLSKLNEETLAHALNVSSFAFGDTNKVEHHHGTKCDRCWNYFDETEENENGEHLCKRCLETVKDEYSED